VHRIILWPLGGLVELGETKGLDVMGRLFGFDDCVRVYVC